MSNSKTLILGAGSSVDYGFKIASKLREDILVHGKSCQPINSNFSPYEINDFLKNFNDSCQTSIDHFIKNRTEYLDIGKYYILYFINKYEIHDFKNSVNSWIPNLYRKYIQYELEKINVLTFNYDRVFEKIIIDAISSNNNKSYQLSIEEFNKKINFVKIHGSCGYLPRFNNNSFNIKWGNEISSRAYANYIQNLEFFHENKNNDSVENIIKNSMKIYFLGFGFDEDNLEKLFSNWNLKSLEIYASIYNEYDERRIRNYFSKKNVDIKIDVDKNLSDAIDRYFAV